MRGTRLTCFVALWCAIALTGSLQAEQYYIATDGVDTNSGAIDSPWGTFDFAIDRLSPGDTLFVRGGAYSLNERLRIRSNEGGAAGNPVNIWAFPDESPVLDFAAMSDGLLGSSSGRGVQIDNDANWLHLKGLTVQNAKDNGVYNEGHNNVFEQLTLRWNADSGLQLDGFASNNHVLNTDSYENYDPHNNGENADGFAAKFDELGPGNVFEGARAWGNSDDGWDLWQAANGVQILNSWAWGNGVNIWNDPAFDGDGNGFKLGQDSGAHLLANVLAWQNQVRGIDVNGNATGVRVYNSTVYDSDRNWQFDEDSDDTVNQHMLRNNISFAGSRADQFFSGVDDSFNSWNGLTARAEDFLSLDPTIAQGPRQADGSLPESDFLRLAPGSNLIDAGVDVGLPFNGTAPDLGAFESTTVASADFNVDGIVDSADLGAWQIGFGTSPDAVHSDGDANLDGIVDGADLLSWQGEFTGAASVASVPEPPAVVLAMMTVMMLVRSQEHRRMVH